MNNETNASSPQDLSKITTAIKKIEGITNIIVNDNTSPVEMSFHTSQPISIKSIEDAVIRSGFHLIEKSILG